MFYNKEIHLLEFSKGYTDDYGIYHDGEEKVIKTLKADVQPYNKELLKKEYGFDTDCSRRIFCDFLSWIETGKIIKYNNKNYKIVAIMWDDEFLDFAVDEV